MEPASPTENAATTEVPDQATRRSFTAEYKKRILREADACKEKGGIAASLRREGLFTSRLTEWRRARDCGELGATKPRGPSPTPDARDRRIAELERELAGASESSSRPTRCWSFKKMALLLETMANDAPGGKHGCSLWSAPRPYSASRRRAKRSPWLAAASTAGRSRWVPAASDLSPRAAAGRARGDPRTPARGSIRR